MRAVSPEAQEVAAGEIEDFPAEPVVMPRDEEQFDFEAIASLEPDVLIAP